MKTLTTLMLLTLSTQAHAATISCYSYETSLDLHLSEHSAVLYKSNCTQETVQLENLKENSYVAHGQLILNENSPLIEPMNTKVMDFFYNKELHELTLTTVDSDKGLLLICNSSR